MELRFTRRLFQDPSITFDFDDDWHSYWSRDDHEFVDESPNGYRIVVQPIKNRMMPSVRYGQNRIGDLTVAVSVTRRSTGDLPPILLSLLFLKFPR